VHQTDVEQRHVDAMYARLDADQARIADEAAQVQRDAADDLREVRLALLNRRAATLRAADQRVCFGRIDHADGTALHLGRVGLNGPDGEPLLVDWRADAARPFYAATPASPDGLRRRRHLTLRGRTVTAVTDELLDGGAPGPDDVVGDTPLLEALTARRTGRMGEVVSTLQAEQDAVIRSPHRGVTVVEGGPGTGKTVVALHRAAYVLAMFDEARADGVLVLGPNARFLDHISDVLPSLGENDVVLSTPTALLGAALAGSLRRAAGGAVPAATARAHRRLGSTRQAVRIADAVRSHQAPGGTLTVVIDGDRITLDERTLAEVRAAAQASDLPHNHARDLFRELVADALADEVQLRARVFLARMDEDMEVLTGGVDVEGAVAADLARLGFAADEGGVYGHRAAVAELDPAALRGALVDDPAVDAAVERAWPRLTPGAVVAELEPGARRWTDAHLPLLDEAADLLDGPPARTFGHVVVDEAQELTPMQWRAVLRRCPARSMTVVGDLAQAGPAAVATTWRQALGEVARHADVRTLTVCYRTTAQVLAEAEPLLAAIAPEQPRSRALRAGPEPRHRLAAGTLADAVRDEAAREAAAGGLVGVVVPDAFAEALGGVLADLADVRVIPVSQVRGLEFDAAVVVDPAGIRAGRESGERDLYVALTRPTSRLVVVTTPRGDEPTPGDGSTPTG